MINDYMVTLDIDWAPDYAIDYVAELLAEHDVRATWFVTHGSPAVTRLSQRPELFELGIHPNFLPGSTHGKTHEEVLSHCVAIVPGARSMRTHGLYQSTPLLEQVLNRTHITADVSLFMPHTRALSPVEYRWHGRELLRIPYYWDDCYEMERISPDWHLAPHFVGNHGLKVFNFHPIHIFLNSPDMSGYSTLKQSGQRLSDISLAEAERFIHPGHGSRTIFLELVQHLERTRFSSRVQDLCDQWRTARSKA
jgi:peptidoglycan/xylan/chitin deacetylase (PgdA/CDA1 family)